MVTSSLLSLLAIVSVIYPGLNYGLDFTGGIIVEVGYREPPELERFARGSTTPASSRRRCRTRLGSEVLIRLPPPEGERRRGAEPRGRRRPCRVACSPC